jgi:DDE superfamily endonuclease
MGLWKEGVSLNGWLDNGHGLTWLTDVFKPWIRERQRGEYLLLILNGHRLHSNLEFFTFYTAK